MTQPKFEVEPLTELIKDVTGWFQRYERTAMMCRWIKTETSDPQLDYLPVYLGGDVLISFNQLDQSVREDYELVKAELIRRYGEKSRDAYKRFITSVYKPHTSIDGYIDGLRKIVDSIGRFPPEGKDKLVLNHFLHSIPMDQSDLILMTCRKDDDLSLSEVVETARALALFRPEAARGFVAGATGSRGVKSEDDRGPRCFNCRGYGHLSKKCPKPRKLKNPPGVSPVARTH